MFCFFIFPERKKSERWEHTHIYFVHVYHSIISVHSYFRKSNLNSQIEVHFMFSNLFHSILIYRYFFSLIVVVIVLSCCYFLHSFCSVGLKLCFYVKAYMAIWLHIQSIRMIRPELFVYFHQTLFVRNNISVCHFAMSSLFLFNTSLIFVQIFVNLHCHSCVCVCVHVRHMPAMLHSLINLIFNDRIIRRCEENKENEEEEKETQSRKHTAWVLILNNRFDTNI